ncbi:hypothetical protein B0O80DRAFT_498767 [Mortierella sp. GBAus27b]|nr:hypothetical protein B0O80DRAFT_498767 [Mortierella sp. GBAus27b]
MSNARRRQPALLTLTLTLTLSLLLVLSLLTTVSAAPTTECPPGSPPGGFFKCVDNKSYLTCDGQTGKLRSLLPLDAIVKVCDPNTPSLSQSSPCQYFGGCRDHIC